MRSSASLAGSVGFTQADGSRGQLLLRYQYSPLAWLSHVHQRQSREWGKKKPRLIGAGLSGPNEQAEEETVGEDSGAVRLRIPAEKRASGAAQAIEQTGAGAGCVRSLGIPGKQR